MAKSIYAQDHSSRTGVFSAATLLAGAAAAAAAMQGDASGLDNLQDLPNGGGDIPPVSSDLQHVDIYTINGFLQSEGIGATAVADIASAEIVAETSAPEFNLQGNLHSNYELPDLAGLEIDLESLSVGASESTEVAAVDISEAATVDTAEVEALDVDTVQAAADQAAQEAARQAAIAERTAAFESLTAASRPDCIEDVIVNADGSVTIQVSDVDSFAVRNEVFGWMTANLGGNAGVEALAQSTGENVTYDIVDNGSADECGDRDVIRGIVLGVYSENPNFMADGLAADAEKGCLDCEAAPQIASVVAPAAPEPPVVESQAYMMADMPAEPAEPVVLPNIEELVGDRMIAQCQLNRLEDVTGFYIGDNGEIVFAERGEINDHIMENGGRSQVFMRFTNEAYDELGLASQDTMPHEIKYGYMRGGAAAMEELNAAGINELGATWDIVITDQPMTQAEFAALSESGQIDQYVSEELTANYRLALADRLIGEELAGPTNGQVTDTMSLFTTINEDLRTGDYEMSQGLREILNEGQDMGYLHQEGDAAGVFQLLMSRDPEQANGYLAEYLALSDTAARENIEGFDRFASRYDSWRITADNRILGLVPTCDDPLTQGARIGSLALPFISGGGGAAAVITDAPVAIPTF